MAYYSSIAQQKNVLLICVDIFNAKTMEGRVYHGVDGKPTLFREIDTIFSVVDAYLNELGLPQASTQRRTFQQKKSAPVKERHLRNKEKEVSCLPKKTLNEDQGDIGTFLVQIKFRQNATWQGEVQWVEKNEKKSFRSALELIMMMNSALSDEEE